jgi:hypothetical protein
LRGAAAILIAGVIAVGWLDRALRGLLAPIRHMDSTLKPT